MYILITRDTYNGTFVTRTFSTEQDVLTVLRDEMLDAVKRYPNDKSDPGSHARERIFSDTQKSVAHWVVTSIWRLNMPTETKTSCTNGLWTTSTQQMLQIKATTHWRVVTPMSLFGVAIHRI